MTTRGVPACWNPPACSDLVLNLTLSCPLRCAHCCYRAGGRATETMSGEVMASAIREAASLGTVRTVHFSGGDPFVVPDLMRQGVGLATALGLRTAAVTSGWFAKSRDRALATLEPLARSGLGELCVSYDDMHAAYLSMEHLVHVMTAVTELGLRGFVSVVVEPQSRINGAWVRSLLEPLTARGCVDVYEVAVNSTGRAADTGDADTREDRAAAEAVYRGPCTGMLRTLQVVHDGRILPCCGTLPHLPAMSLGRIQKEGALARALREASRDPLWMWIASRGPVDLLAEVTAETDQPLLPGSFDGVCTACDLLFTRPGLLEAARAHVAGAGSVAAGRGSAAL